jgi:hypothetical protein
MILLPGTPKVQRVIISRRDAQHLKPPHKREILMFSELYLRMLNREASSVRTDPGTFLTVFPSGKHMQ